MICWEEKNRNRCKSITCQRGPNERTNERTNVMRKSTDIDKIEMGVHSGRYLGSFFSFWYSFLVFFFSFWQFFSWQSRVGKEGHQLHAPFHVMDVVDWKERKKRKKEKVVPRKNKPGMKIAHKTMKLTRVWLWHLWYWF